MKLLYPFDPVTRLYSGYPQPWPIDPVATEMAGETVYAQLSDPPQSTSDTPPAIPDGMLARRLADGSGWELVLDTLGVWWDPSGQRVLVDRLEQDVQALSRIPPPNETSKLVGGEWVDDPVKVQAAALAAADANVATGMAVASGQLAVLQDTVELGIATQAEMDAHTEWRRYRVLLSRLKSDPSYPNVAFPLQPEKVIP